MFKFLSILLLSLFLLSGCITVKECAGDHKETYNNISPTNNGDVKNKDQTP